MPIFNMIYGGGGGDASLGFSVVAQETQPTSPTENMIWVETSAEMTGWVLSAAAPESPVEGTVWISTGTSSLVSFNALGGGENTLMVYPLNVSQYNNGAWASVSAMSYINGEWVVWWNGILFDNGDQYEAITGGWEQNAGFIYSSSNQSMGTVTIGNTLKCVCSSGKTSYAVTKNKIDVTDYSTLNVTVTSKGRKEYELALMAEPGNVQNNNVAYIPLSNYENSMDISTISGSYYVVVGSAGDGTVEATKVWLEK